MFDDDSNPPEVRVIPRHQRPLVLVCQAMVGEVSGGHVFNQRMILEAQRSEVSLRALTPEQVLDGEGAEASVFLWDSLDIPLLAASGSPPFRALTGFSCISFPLKTLWLRRPSVFDGANNSIVWWPTLTS